MATVINLSLHWKLLDLLKSYREQIRQQLALQEGLKANMDIGDDELKAAWDSFHPEVEAQLIKLTSEDDAKDVLKEAQKDGADFSKLAKEKSTDTATAEDGGTVKFDSTSTTVPAGSTNSCLCIKKMVKFQRSFLLRMLLLIQQAITLSKWSKTKTKATTWINTKIKSQKSHKTRY